MKSLLWTIGGCALLALIAAYPGAQEKSAAPGKAGSPDNGAKAGPSSPVLAPAAEDDNGVQLFRLQRVDVKTCQTRLARMFPAEIKQERLRMSADAHTNELLVHAPQELLVLIEGVLRGLDNAESEETTDGNQKPAGDKQDRGEDNAPAAVKIFRLRRADASESRQLLREMYRSEFQIAADVRTNTLVVRGTPEILAMIEAVLINLDDIESADKPPAKRVADRQNGTDDTIGGPPQREATTRDDWRTSLQDAADPDSEVQRVRENFRRLDQKAAEQARQYREAHQAAATKGVSSLEDPSSKKLKAELEETVQAAFDARQKVQSYEVDRLRQRLAQIESRLTMRDRLQEEIVRQRVEELLHPERTWEPGGEASGSPTTADAAAGAAKKNSPNPPNAAAGPAQDIWMTDMAAARAEAEKAGRLLLLYFRPKPSTSRQKQEVDLAASPSVKKVLQNFVLVAIDTSDPANQQVMEEYRISDTPKVVVTDAAAQPLYATERDPFRDRWNMDELRQHLTGLVQRYLSERSASASDATVGSESPSSASARARRSDSAVLPDDGKSPRDALLDAEWAVGAARAALVAAEKSHDFSQSDLKHTQDLHQKGAVPFKAVLTAERQVSDDDTRLERAKLELQHAERRSKLARENLESRIKLLELDMVDARLRIDHLAGEEARARRLLESKAMSNVEYDESKLALERAKLQLSRLSELMELYSKPIPGTERMPAVDGKKGPPDSRSKIKDDETSPRRP
jgi:hypothetical protein